MEIAIPAFDFVARLQKRVLADFAAAVEEWSGAIAALTRWEDEHLLDHPAPELLADHRSTLERMLAFGRFLSLATEPKEFPDRPTAEMVAATQFVLQEKLRMWHEPRMSQPDSDRILAAVFPDEP